MMMTRSTFVALLVAPAAGVVSASPVARQVDNNNNPLLSNDNAHYFECGSCAELVPDSGTCNADGSQTVTVDFSNCKGGALSWVTSQCGTQGLSSIDSCSEGSMVPAPNGVKCEHTTTVTYTIAQGLNYVPILVHDRKALDTVGVDFSCAAGNAGGSCGATGVCQSNLVFTPAPCEIDPQPPQVCTQGETAWATGYRYTQQGNWATYTASSLDTPTTPNIMAGQTKPAGTVTIIPNVPETGKTLFFIQLDDQTQLKSTMENIKIQSYASAPSGKPSPGLFTCKQTIANDAKSFNTECPSVAPYWGIHLDVDTIIPCDQ